MLLLFLFQERKRPKLCDVLPILLNRLDDPTPLDASHLLHRDATTNHPPTRRTVHLSTTNANGVDSKLSGGLISDKMSTENYDDVSNDANADPTNQTSANDDGSSETVTSNKSVGQTVTNRRKDRRSGLDGTAKFVSSGASRSTRQEARSKKENDTSN